MNNVAIFFLSFGIAFSGALAPGPLLTLVIRESFNRGPWAGPLIIIGHAILEIIMIGLILLGLDQFLENPVLRNGIILFGALILIWFGSITLKTKAEAALAASSAPQKNLILAGIIMSAANPYWSLWWITVGTGLILSALKAGVSGLAWFFAGHILADLIWYTFISAIIGSGRKFIPLRLYRSVLFGCGLSLIGFGLFFFAQFIRNISTAV